MNHLTSVMVSLLALCS